jgi:hypothetical protein
MASFEDEISDGFAELAAEAGTAAGVDDLKFKGVVVAGGGVLDTSSEEPMRVDLKLGTVRRCRLMVTRAAIAALADKPATGEVFTLGAKKLRIEDIEDEDPTDNTVSYLVKVSG